MEKWEYRQAIERLPSAIATEMDRYEEFRRRTERALNTQGAEGWELVAVLPLVSTQGQSNQLGGDVTYPVLWQYVLKRRIVED